MALKITIPNLAGTLLLVVLLAAMYPIFDLATNLILPQLGSLESQLVKLVVPFIILAILSNIWATDPETGEMQV